MDPRGGGGHDRVMASSTVYPPGLGTALIDLLAPVATEGRATGKLFGGTDDERTRGVLDAASGLLSASLPRDLVGWALRTRGGPITMQLSGPVDTDGAWVLADALRAATDRPGPVSLDGDGCAAFAIATGRAMSIGVCRRGRALQHDELWMVQSVALACHLAGRG
ncbi:MAG: hypothetical protein QOI47_867 [Actinomycetota bacterium]|nr:hypothetical protein [Actinomycetota bacterium]